MEKPIHKKKKLYKVRVEIECNWIREGIISAKSASGALRKFVRICDIADYHPDESRHYVEFLGIQVCKDLWFTRNSVPLVGYE